METIGILGAGAWGTALALVASRAGKKIFAGDISIHPYSLDGKSGCDYCPYHTVCGFDTRMPGYSYHKLEKFDSADEILKRMENEKQEQ